MPFAPVLTDRLASSCFLSWSYDDASCRYMTRTYDCTKLFQQTCPAVVHKDGTARPQVVFREDDEFMHSLLTDWYEASGCHALVNTSFNRHEEPIIRTPEEGVRSLEEGMIDALLVNDRYLLQAA